jgi:hypothetical protein
MSPQERAIYESNARNRQGLSDLAGQGVNSLQGLIGQQLDLSSLGDFGDIFGGVGDLGTLDPNSLPSMPGVFNPGSLGAMPPGYRGASNLPDMPQASEAVRERVIAAMNSRADQDFGKRREQQQADLVARGLAPGTEAFAREMDMLERSRNDARQQAEIAGGDAAAQAFGMDLSRRQQGYDEQTTDAQLIYDQAMGIRRQGAGEQAQQFTQGMGVRGQALGEQDQGFRQRGQQAELGMRGQAQRNTQQTDRRRQQIAELLTRRQTPLNEIIALMGGSGVQNPFAIGGYNGNSNVAPAPIFGAAQAQSNHNTDIYNAGVANRNSQTQAAGTLGAAAIAAMF